MPVQIQCTAVVIRNDALDRCLDGGSGNFESIAPNTMSYSDDQLSQVSFMSPLDAEEFAKALELRGLEREGFDPDFVLVDSHDQSVHPPCEWLVLFRYEGRLIATIAGSESRKVIAPAIDREYDPDAVRRYTADEVESKLEFVERDGSLDVYREKETGKLVYHARQTETDDERFRSAFKTIWKYRRDPGMPPLQGRPKTAVTEALETLQSLLARHPESARVLIGVGKAWFGIGNHERSTRAWSRAHDLDPENTIILKEWAGVSLVTGEFATALELGAKAVSLKPDDVELLGNLAIIQLLNGQVPAAARTIDHAMELDPDDDLNRRVALITSDVASGKRPRPETLRQMMQPTRRKPWWSRLFGIR